MKTVMRVTMAIMLLGAGAAVGYPMGQYSGFSRGSEWALVQADIVAREAGVFMPVRFEDDAFHVVLKQPKGIYSNSRRLAGQDTRPYRDMMPAPEEPMPELAYLKH